MNNSPAYQNLIKLIAKQREIHRPVGRLRPKGPRAMTGYATSNNTTKGKQMINKIPFIGWILSAIAAIGLAVPFWFFWTYWELGKEYFFFLPPVYQAIPFWNCVGLFVIVAILKGTLIPKVFSVSNEQKVGGA